jgi:hypothetical protein
MKARAAAGFVSALLAACASGPPQPDWQMNAHAEMQRALAAQLAGDARQAAAAEQRARSEIARTGRLDLLARAELMLCAARVASLDFEPCGRAEALLADATPADRAYAAYLRGEALSADQQALLPDAQRGAAAAGGEAAALARIEDPVAQLVAAGVALRSGRASPAQMTLAADTASAQGWRRPLLAWLTLLLQRAQQAGDGAETERLKRRIALVSGTLAPVPAAPPASR